MGEEFQHSLVASDLAHIIDEFELEGHPLGYFVVGFFEISHVGMDELLQEIHGRRHARLQQSV